MRVPISPVSPAFPFLIVMLRRRHRAVRHQSPDPSRQSISSRAEPRVERSEPALAQRPSRVARCARMNAAVIVAGGKGTRMGAGRDKLFLEVAGRPVVAHTWEQFDRADCIDQIVVVVREGLQQEFVRMAEQYCFSKPHRIVVGGAERQDSVWNGLEALSAETGIVAIQDAARPCVTEALIEATVVAAQETGAAVAAQPVVDTIKESADGRLIERTLPRSRLWAVQTPQTFRVPVIRRAIQAARERGESLTDDTAACELIGQPVRLVVSNDPNPKVTIPADLPYVETLLAPKGPR
jgi:2-C-methyl-D-erythritol 4-phosphate cytidylyltransferase